MQYGGKEEKEDSIRGEKIEKQATGQAVKREIVTAWFTLENKSTG